MIGLQMTLPEVTAHMAQSHVAVGLSGEIAIAHAFEANDYAVDVAHENGDLHVIDKHGVIHHVEVKTARKCSDGKWRFTLWKKGSQNHRNTDFVVLYCLTKTGYGIPFVIPTSELLGQNAAVISSYPQTYKGRLAQYRQSMRKLRLPECDGAE